MLPERAERWAEHDHIADIVQADGEYASHVGWTLGRPYSVILLIDSLLGQTLN